MELDIQCEPCVPSGVEAEEGMGGVCAVLSAHQAPVLPSSPSAARPTAQERL